MVYEKIPKQDVKIVLGDFNANWKRSSRKIFLLRKRKSDNSMRKFGVRFSS